MEPLNSSRTRNSFQQSIIINKTLIVLQYGIFKPQLMARALVTEQAGHWREMQEKTVSKGLLMIKLQHFGVARMGPTCKKTVKLFRMTHCSYKILNIINDYDAISYFWIKQSLVGIYYYFLDLYLYKISK